MFPFSIRVFTIIVLLQYSEYVIMNYQLQL
jgi:hypothetical protein